MLFISFHTILLILLLLVAPLEGNTLQDSVMLVVPEGAGGGHRNPILIVKGHNLSDRWVGTFHPPYSSFFEHEWRQGERVNMKLEPNAPAVLMGSTLSAKMLLHMTPKWLLLVGISPDGGSATILFVHDLTTPWVELKLNYSSRNNNRLMVNFQDGGWYTDFYHTSNEFTSKTLSKEVELQEDIPISIQNMLINGHTIPGDYPITVSLGMQRHVTISRRAEPLRIAPKKHLPWNGARGPGDPSWHSWW